MSAKLVNNIGIRVKSIWNQLTPWGGQNFVDKTLSLILIVAILGGIGALGYVIATPDVGERFTEFYILGPEGEAKGYPEGLVVGDTGWVIVGIINREREPVTYHVEAAINGVKNNEMGPVMLEHGDKWEEMMDFTPDRAGHKQKVEFSLYKQGQSEAYLTLHLWLNVKE